jgi:hypothetical protein
VDTKYTNSCPFCGNNGVDIAEYYLKNVGRYNFRCKCSKCKTEGPASTTKDGAFRKWGIRAESKENAQDRLTLIEDITTLIKLKKKCSFFTGLSNYSIEDAVLEYGVTHDWVGSQHLHFCGKFSDDDVCKCKLCQEIPVLVKRIYKGCHLYAP